MAKELSSDDIRAVFDPSMLETKKAERESPLDDVIGQERALKALTFGLEIREKGRAKRISTKILMRLEIF